MSDDTWMTGESIFTEDGKNVKAEKDAGLVEVKKFNKTEQPVTTSLAVAETFGKQHFNVLQDIRNLACSREFRLLNFQESAYLNAQKRRQPMYIMTRDGFTLLVMGYTGEKAMRFKEAYLKAFNRMEAELTSKRLVRERGKAARRNLTDTIQEIYGCARLKPNPYAKYTEMVYMAVFGCHTCKLKKLKGLDEKDNLRDFLSKEELAAVGKVERAIGVGLEFGWDDARVIAFLRDNFKKPVLMLDATEETDER